MADKQLKESTLNIYNKRLATIAKKCGYSEIPEGEIALWLDEHFDSLIDQERLHNAKAFCNCILYFSKDQSFKEKVKIKRQNIVNISSEIRKEVEEIEQRVKWTKVEELQEIYDTYNSLRETGEINRDVFIILFYSFPFHDSNFPVFRNELRTLIYGQYEQDGRNYYDGSNIFLSEKGTNNTSKTRVQIIKVPDELRQIFELWIKTAEINEGDLIVNVSTARMTQILKDNLGVGTMILRKIYSKWTENE